MRFSIWPINQQPIGEVLAVAGRAEAIGWHGVWTADHLMSADASLAVPVLEAWTTTTAIATTTSRLRVGTLVMNNLMRHPGVLAKMAGTLDALAPGRVVLGIGAGWQENEHQAYGIALPAPGERLARLDEACGLIRALLEEGQASFVGRYYTITDAVAIPRPGPGRVRLLVGARGDRALRLVARHADEWNLWATPDVFRERVAELHRACDEVGRDPASIRKTAQAVVHHVTRAEPDRRWARAVPAAISGTAAELQAHLAQYADAGLDEFVVPDFTMGAGAAKLDALDAFHDEVVSEMSML